MIFQLSRVHIALFLIHQKKDGIFLLVTFIKPTGTVTEMNQQMFTCQNCGGMRFAPGVPYQYTGQLCNCPNPAISQMGLVQPMQQQPMNISSTDYQILQALDRIEKLLIKLIHGDGD